MRLKEYLTNDQTHNQPHGTILHLYLFPIDPWYTIDNSICPTVSNGWFWIRK